MDFLENARFWIGVASRNHVKIGEKGGFCQLGHGKMEPVERLRQGDGIIYYSPREQLRGGPPVQAFTAVGQVLDNVPYQVEQRPGFKPMRRDVRYWPSRDTPIRTLLDRLSFLPEGKNWGIVFRRGSFSIPRGDFMMIAEQMRVDIPAKSSHGRL